LVPAARGLRGLGEVYYTPFLSRAILTLCGVGGYNFLITQVPIIYMWVKRLFKLGDKHCVTVPAKARRQLGWERGEWVHIRIVNNEAIVLEKFRPSAVPDRILEAMKPVPTISYV